MVKGAIRSRQLAAARNRMMADVATADVVLVNPTHVAVALRYDARAGRPRVVARGAGAIAAKIRERAAEERVPLVRDVPLARALYTLHQGRPGDPARAVRRRRPGAGVRDQPSQPRASRRRAPLPAPRGRAARVPVAAPASTSERRESLRTRAAASR